MGEDGQRHPLPVDPEIEAAREDRRVAGLPHLRSLLEGRDLGQVERIAHVDAVAREVDGGEVVDGEVAERVGRRGTREHGCAEDPEQRHEDDEPFHWSAFLATGAQRIEKWGLSASARRRVLREASR